MGWVGKHQLGNAPSSAFAVPSHHCESLANSAAKVLSACLLEHAAAGCTWWRGAPVQIVWGPELGLVGMLQVHIFVCLGIFLLIACRHDNNKAKKSGNIQHELISILRINIFIYLFIHSFIYLFTLYLCVCVFACTYVLYIYIYTWSRKFGKIGLDPFILWFHGGQKHRELPLGFPNFDQDCPKSREIFFHFCFTPSVGSRGGNSWPDIQPFAPLCPWGHQTKSEDEIDMSTTKGQ